MMSIVIGLFLQPKGSIITVGITIVRRFTARPTVKRYRVILSFFCDAELNKVRSRKKCRPIDAQ